MSAAKTGICNLAIAHCGVGVQIADITTENSAEARTCRLFYPKAKNETLRDFEWPFATVFETLQLVSSNPTTEWGYAYQYPNDCVYFRRILSGIRMDSLASRVPYIFAQSSTAGDAKEYIYTDQANAVAELTGKVENVTLFPHDFEMAFSYKLAAYIAVQITRGDPFKVGDRAEQKYTELVQKAAATNKNEQYKGLEQDTGSILARNTGIGCTRRYPWE